MVLSNVACFTGGSCTLLSTPARLQTPAAHAGRHQESHAPAEPHAVQTRCFQVDLWANVRLFSVVRHCSCTTRVPQATWSSAHDLAIAYAPQVSTLCRTTACWPAPRTCYKRQWIAVQQSSDSLLIHLAAASMSAWLKLLFGTPALAEARSRTPRSRPELATNQTADTCSSSFPQVVHKV
jgi:hypothetical protein